MRKLIHTHRRRKSLLIVMLTACALSSAGCWDSDLVKRFREGWGPGFVSGISYAISNPGEEDTGYQQAFSALFAGLGNLISPRTGSSAESSN